MIDAAAGTDLADALARSVTRLAAVDAELIALTVSRHRQQLRHHFTPAPGPVDVRSLAKVVTVLTLGAAAARGAPILGPHPVDLDLAVGPLLPALPGRPAFRSPDRWQRVRLRHLLASTTGHDSGFLFRTDAADLIADRPEDLIGYVSHRELAHEPGTHFAYSNAGWFLLSVLVSELSGRSVADWTGDLLLEPLGVSAEDWSWRRYGRYPAAATGLRIRPEHLHRLAQLLLDGGRQQGHRLVHVDWITAMSSPQATPSPPEVTGEPGPIEPLRRSAYGLGLWLSRPAGRCYGEGADGQYLVVDPGSATAITLTAVRADPGVQPAIRAALAPLLPTVPPAAGPARHRR